MPQTIVPLCTTLSTAARRALLAPSRPSALWIPSTPRLLSLTATRSLSYIARRCSPSPKPCRLYHRRPYHSHDHPAPPGPFSATEEAILSAAYRRVPTHGFSTEALALGARDAGLLDISATILPDGDFMLIQWHLVKQREALAARKAALFGEGDESSTAASIADKVETLTWERLLSNKEIIGRWQEALAVMAQPTYVPTSVKELALLVDEIWYLAGDVSVDPAWYTKRASLSAIYAAAELFMTNDHSPDFCETREFLRRRLHEASEVGNMTGSVKEWVNFTASAAVNVLRSKGVPV